MTGDSLPAQLVRTRRFTLGAPDRFSVAPDGGTVLFLRSRSGDDPVGLLWALDTGTGTERLLADPGPESGPGITGYATDRAVRLAAYAVGGELWTVRVGGGPARRLPATGTVVDPRPDPTGRRVAYRDGDALRVIAADGTGDRALATPDRPDTAVGTAPHTSATCDGPRGFWWSPDGTRLLAAGTDSAPVAHWYLADPARPEHPPRAYRYAAVGQANPDVTLWLTELDGTRTEAGWDRVGFEYVIGAGWDDHGPYALVQSRDQRTVRLLGIDPVGGHTTVLAEQHDACWVHPVPGLPARTAAGTLVGHTDHGATRHLTVDGTPVTPPGLHLRAVLGVEGEQVLFTASEDPTETHLWRYDPNDGPVRLTEGPGLHTGAAAGGTLVVAARRRDHPSPRVTVVRDGRPPLPVASLTERPVLRVCATPLVLGSDELRAMLYLPSWHRPGDGPLPVLADPYGGGGQQRVTAELDWRSLVSQWFAEQGFAVLVADGRGTPGRGPEWERTVYGDLFGQAVDDQVTAVQEAARIHPDLDLTRVAVRGWSFGGSLATAAVLRRPDVFHAAVAGAGVTDQYLYDARWRERFLGHPADFPDRYAASSLIRQASGLRRPLLLMHGLADDNVHPGNTLRLSAALLAAGRPHEVLLLPGIGHQPMQTPGVTEGLLRHQRDFLRRHLDIPDRPAAQATRATSVPGVTPG